MCLLVEGGRIPTKVCRGLVTCHSTFAQDCSRLPIDNIDTSIRIRFDDPSSQRALVCDVDKHGKVRRAAIATIVRSYLGVPFEFAGLRVESQDTFSFSFLNRLQVA